MANLRMALLWCCATIVLLLLSQAIYPWVGIWETRNSPPVYSRLIPLEELCAPISVDASTVRKGLRDTGEVEVEVGPMMWRVSFTAWRAWCWRRALAPPRGHHLLMTVLQIRGVAPRATMKV